jgi:hypothetical protein
MNRALSILSCAAAGLICAMALLGASKARSHDWYPWDCCHDLDCAPVDQAEYLGSAAKLTTKLGTVIVPGSFPRRPSPDGRQHVCIKPDGTPRCYFVPAEG